MKSLQQNNIINRRPEFACDGASVTIRTRKPLGNRRGFHTATKREESLRDVPMSVSVLGSDTIEAKAPQFRGIADGYRTDLQRGVK